MVDAYGLGSSRWGFLLGAWRLAMADQAGVAAAADQNGGYSFATRCIVQDPAGITWKIVPHQCFQDSIAEVEIQISIYHLLPVGHERNQV
jgi:hypothetical protein